MSDKAVDTHPSAMKYVSEWYKTQEVCYKAVHICFVFLSDSISDQILSNAH